MTVRSNGKVTERWIEETSGMPAFDRSVLAAVKRAEPLPPFPSYMEERTLDVVLRFRAEDLI